MADMLNDGNIKCTFVPAIANTAAPTTTELAAGTALECLITADGFEPDASEDKVSVPKLCETTTAEAPGRSTYHVKLTMVRKTLVSEDVAWSTLLRGTAGFLVFRYGVSVATAYASTQKVQVWPGTFGERQPQKPEMNGATKFMSEFYISSQPKMDAVIA